MLAKLIVLYHKKLDKIPNSFEKYGAAIIDSERRLVAMVVPWRELEKLVENLRRNGEINGISYGGEIYRVEESEERFKT